ncbi:heparinase II/III domain-containing protein [Fibrella aquatica]|uniref:heparinase II/III domain-containing protein n=1 Tax=Fibrella aquatica TaxID=3242487 RepID=UPI00352010D5
MSLYWRTLRHLTIRQVGYQVWNRLRPSPRLSLSDMALPANVPNVALPITFTFLSQSVTFTERIDWNYAANGKLWTYTLNYFDWLQLPEYEAGQQGTALIYDFIRQTASLQDGLEPYPTSLRLLNWRAFLIREAIQDPVIEQHLHAQTALLRSRLEYHLGGNHLLENACALTVMALRFQHKPWFLTGASLLRTQLTEQILADGGHYERSPVYHQLLTDRLLDVYAILQADSWANEPGLTAFVHEKTAAMLNWLVAVTFRDGSVPMVNDAAYGVAPTTAELVQKAALLGFQPTPVSLSDSGYRMLTTPRLELFIDIGPVGPNHQPGHAHADTFSFILHIDGQPVLVDPGTSTYQIGEQRHWERSTAAHNTVTINDQNSSEVWSGFRVGRRAQVHIALDTPTCVEASHDGYQYLGERHTRRWEILDGDRLVVRDSFTNPTLMRTYHLHTDHGLPLSTTEQNVVDLPNCSIQFNTDVPLHILVSAYHQAVGFNVTRSASQLACSIPAELTTLFTARP